MDIFENEDYKLISQMIEKRLPYLRENKQFNEKYVELADTMDELENSLSDEQKDEFHKIVKLFYETEQYYFALSYSLGVKYGKQLNDI